MTESAFAVLIASIYSTVEEISLWQNVVESLSRAVGDNATYLSLSLHDFDARELYFRSHQVENRRGAMEKHLREGLPWGSMSEPVYAQEFKRLHVDPARLRTSEVYSEWMRPQGLAPEAPIAHRIAGSGNAPRAAILLFRRKGLRPFTSDDLALCNRLVPHLREAYDLTLETMAADQDRLAFSRVIDRIPLGILLVDPSGRLVLSNLQGRSILEEADGFSLVDGNVVLGTGSAQAGLTSALATASHDGATAALPLGVPRPSGRRPYAMSVHPLPGPPVVRGPAGTRDAVLSLFVSDPEAAKVYPPGALQNLYGLTPTEEELVHLLVGGVTIEDAAERRGVKVNTVRSQVKAIYSKTNSHHVGELVHLVLTGVGGLNDGVRQEQKHQ